MKAQLYKQIRLVAHPMTFVFSLFGVMLLIPNYPYTVSFFYTTLGIFFMFQNAREQRDSYYSALLPIRKRDTVKAAVVFCVGLELFSLIIAAPFAVLSARINPNGENLAGTDANMALFGLGFLLYGLFNLVFFPSYYRTGYKVGMAFLKGSTAVFLVVACDVVLPHVPGFQFLDGNNAAAQLPILAIGAAVFAAFSLLAYRHSANLYEKVDL